MTTEEREMTGWEYFEMIRQAAFKDVDPRWINDLSTPFDWCPTCQLPLQISDACVKKYDTLLNIYQCPKCGHIEEVEI